MKIKIGIVVLAAACVGLVIALLAVKKQAETQHNTDAQSILEFSNQLTTANINLVDLSQVNLVLSNDLAGSRQQEQTFSNNLAETSDALASTKTSLQGAMDQITNLDGRIADLEAQNEVLDQRANSLSNTIAGLNSQIADTEQKLASSETNNTFLTAELQRQMAEKADLQRKFNDLDEVRDQVKKLRDELFVTRRLQWMREGVDATSQQKGAQLLNQHQPPAGTASKQPANYDLNVEIGSDGSVHVIPPLTNLPATNAPSQ
ncbi:MAG TPA: hypothetical protein VMD57_04805 [Candidatus Baltobacteraceae bacterium]|nr:hypothetical protein [Candidatus Baltobacteraceae bacterium]